MSELDHLKKLLNNALQEVEKLQKPECPKQYSCELIIRNRGPLKHTISIFFNPFLELRFYEDGSGGFYINDKPESGFHYVVDMKPINRWLSAWEHQNG